MRTHQFLLFILCIVLGLFPETGAAVSYPVGSKEQLTQTSNHFANVIEKAKPGVVYIHVTKKNKAKSKSDSESFYSSNPVLQEWFGEKNKDSDPSLFDDKVKYDFGSGFIFNEAGYILTNSHVIKDGVEVTVTLADKTKHQAKIIGSDAKTDIGLLKIDKSGLPFLPLGDSDLEKVGSWVLAIGSPYEFTQTVTAGIISATGRSSVGISEYEDFIQTDAAINPGNSGGPLININGKVIGINTAFLTRTGGYMGIGFAVPVNMARLVTEQLINKGKVTRAWLGVGIVNATPRQLKKLGLPPLSGGARIVKLKDPSPALEAGLHKQDIIVRIDGNSIKGAADLRNRISLSTPRSPIELDYYREGQLLQKIILLGTLQ